MSDVSQTLREQIERHRMRSGRTGVVFCEQSPDGEWVKWEDVKDRLASLEQQVTVVDNLSICGAECEAIADRLEAAVAQVASLEQQVSDLQSNAIADALAYQDLEAQVASLEQAQQALRKENGVLAEQVRRAFEVLRITVPVPTADRNAEQLKGSL